MIIIIQNINQSAADTLCNDVDILRAETGPLNHVITHININY
jgi:hypothetical protein